MLDFITTELNIRFDAASSHGITEITHLLPSQLVITVMKIQQTSHILAVGANDLPCIKSLAAELQIGTGNGKLNLA